MFSELQPPRAIGALVGGVLTLWCFLLTGALLWRGLSLDISLQAVGPYLAATFFFGLGSLFAYWTYGCWSLHYGLDRNALTIAWAGNRYRVPLKDITALEAGPSGVGGLWWPGRRTGRTTEVLMFATEGPATLVTTPSRTYAISPPDPAAFAEELTIRARLGPTEDASQEAARWWPWELPIWQDRTALALLALSLVLNLALFAHQALAMPSLPDLVPVHFTALGLVDRAGLKAELFEIPLGGFVLLVANTILATLLRRVEPFAAYVALGTGLVLQLFLWSAWLRVLA